MPWSVVVLASAMAIAVVSHFLVHVSIVIFLSSAVALILLSKFLGDATEELSHHIGERLAGLCNVSLSNLAELIIIFVAVKSNLIDLVQAGIVGSVIGNILFVMGLSIYLGCRKNGTLEFNHDTAMLFVNQLFLVGATLMLPTLFNDYIPNARQQGLSWVLALMLVVAYLYFYRLSLVDKRFRVIAAQEVELHRRRSRRWALTVLLACGVGAFFMSEFLVDEVEVVAHDFHLSTMFIGFIILPLLGNIAEHIVAVVAARKRKVELSLAISLGSAAQVAMIVAPAAVLFGFLLGNPVTLHFPNLPLAALSVSFLMTFVVLHDNKWNVNEGVMMLAFYAALVVCFAFAT